jgi:hypothetical protein
MLSGLLAVLIVGSIAGSVEAESHRGCYRTPCYPRYEWGYDGGCGAYGGCSYNRGYGGYRGYGDYGGYGNYGGYREDDGYGW